MITNPHTVVLDEALRQEAIEDGDKDGAVRRAQVRIKPLTYNPDAEIDKMVRTVSTSLIEVDAVLMERPHRGAALRPVHYPTFEKFMESKQARKRILDHVEGRDLRDLNARLREAVAKDGRKGVQRAIQRASRLREHTNHTTGPGNSNFDLGLYPDEVGSLAYGQRSVFPIQDTVLPSLNSPHAKQQLFMDYLDMHRKAWEAATRNPIGKRICDLIPQFVLGRGLTCTIDEETHQFEWDTFWQRNRMRWRMRQILKELLIYGEVFLRYFDTKDGLLVRSLDPSTIWDIITDPDDIESVDFYHQQYTLLINSPVAYRYTQMVPSQLIIRQIPGAQIDHFKINCTSSEKRGRSQLYTILGWLLRFKEFCNDRVLQNKMRAMFSLDVTVKSGDPSDILTVEELFNRPPAPGSVLIHNDAVELEFKNALVGAADVGKDADMLLKVIALGSGVSEQFLGVSAASTRAGALIQTEPDVKNFETYQEITEDILGSAHERLRVKKRLKATKARFEVTFPALAQEDRSAKLKDIALAEGMDYFSKARAASMAAKEFNVTGYNYEIERQQILEERATSPMMAKGMEQMPKITQDPAMGGGLIDPQGTPGPKPSPLNDDTKGVTQTSGEMGMSARNLSGRGQANTQATLDRGGFTRGGERNSIKTGASAGAPLRASAEGTPKPRNVWSEKARAAALASRRANRARREALQPPPEE